MIESDLSVVKATLGRLRKTSKAINAALKVVSLLLLIFLVGFSLVAFFSLSNEAEPVIASTLELIVIILYGLVIIGGLLGIASLFSDAAKGQSPFTIMQVSRLRFIALLFLLYTILDSFLSTGWLSYLQIGGIDVGYTIVGDRPDGLVCSINAGSIMGAAFFFALSLIFKYGVLLQEFTDETL